MNDDDDNVVGLPARVRPRPLVLRSADDLEGISVPDREWLISDVLIRGGVTLFSGNGGLGKSLLCLQLQVACALGRSNWLGMKLPGRPMTTFGYYCEDDVDEIHRRIFNICKHMQVNFRHLDGRVQYLCRVGEEHNELMVFNSRDDTGKRTPMFSQLADMIRAYGVEITIIDTVADTFLGNENVRPQVRAYIGALRHLALINRGGVLLTAHPSRAGLADRSGLSGSTAWEGSVRARIYLTKPSTGKDDDGDDKPTDERLLRVMKSNYGPPGGKVRIKWHKEGHLFVPSDEQPVENWYADR